MSELKNEKINEDIIPQGNEWMKKEIEDAESKSLFGEKLPSLIFEENKVTEFSVDFSKPFEQWVDKEDNKIKKIIPVTHKEERKNLWLNIKNPLYLELMKRGLQGITTFKVIQMGNKSNTKYAMVD